MNKSLETDYHTFKRRYKNANAGTILDARNDFDYLKGSNAYLKKKTKEKLKRLGVKINDIPSLN